MAMSRQLQSTSWEPRALQQTQSAQTTSSMSRADRSASNAFMQEQLAEHTPELAEEDALADDWGMGWLDDDSDWEEQAPEAAGPEEASPACDAMMAPDAGVESMPCSDFSEGLTDILTGKRRINTPPPRRRDKPEKPKEPGLIDRFKAYMMGLLPSLAPKGAPVKQFQKMLNVAKEGMELNTGAMRDVGTAIQTGKNVEKPKTLRDYTDVLKKGGQGIVTDSMNAPIDGLVDKVVGDPLKGAAKGVVPEKLIDKGLDGFKEPLSPKPKAPAKGKSPAIQP